MVRLRNAWLACSPTGGADDLAVGVDAADVDRLRRLFDHDGLAEGRGAVEPSG